MQFLMAFLGGFVGAAYGVFLLGLLIINRSDED